MNRRKKTGLILLAAAAAAGFGLFKTANLNAPASLPPQMAAPAAAETIPPTKPQPTAPPTEAPCYYVWASQPLDEASAQITSALQAAGLEAEARAQAYGENCQTEEGEIRSFAAMQTDLYLTLQVSSLDDRAALGDLLWQSLDILAGLPTELWAQPNPGQLSLTFDDGQGHTLKIWQPLMKALSLRAEGLRGAALLDALTAP